MLLAIAVTSWHSQSYQLIIHDCRIRWQHDLTLLLHLQFNAQCIQDVRLMQMLHMLDVDAPRLHIHLREMGNTQTDAKIEPIFDPIYAKISRNADG